MSNTTTPSLLLIGASRGLGLAMAEAFVERGWRVVGTVRGSGRTGLHDLADRHPDRIAIEQVDVTDEAALAALGDRLAPRRFEMLFVNAGAVNRRLDDGRFDTSTDEFVRVLTTNALGPWRAVERLAPRVTDDGLIGVMSSGQGSLANNEKGGNEVYRCSKSALNMLMRSYAASAQAQGRSLLLMAPGWIRTEMGGPEAPASMDEAVPQVVDVVLAQRGRPGLRYLDRQGRTVPW